MPDAEPLRYEGPIDEVAIRIGSTQITLIRPADPDRMLDAPETDRRNRESGYMPYSVYLWPSSLLLAHELVRLDLPNGLPVLELGCGLGLVGLVGADRGLRMVCTDSDPIGLSFLERSREANQFSEANLRIAQLRYLDPMPGRFGLVLGADLFYERPLVHQVFDALNRALVTNGAALMASPYRSSLEEIDACCASYGFRYRVTEVESTDDRGAPIQGYLYRIWRAEVISESTKAKSGSITEETPC